MSYESPPPRPKPRKRKKKFKIKKKYKRFLLPLLIAYKLKFFTLIPVFIGKDPKQELECMKLI